ncbi:S8 family serine peptidase [Hymenobacter volaticus]|uniref:S8 family serine peptidase n=1 Tax=Hymenobacter volaticus TaxID=2932254 RepID=A0ABY4G1V0_9BACT|nr:S8 family serine peptidase [Hymenobacter volaticus]UOQ64803.1 S8 family serine peptidase [Hymenobacter volaticus]
MSALPTRNERVTLLFFSAGKANTQFAAQRPWANHARTFGIAASTENEHLASYSNFGEGIDLCAPSSDENIGLRSITNTSLPGGGDLAGHTGGPDDYTAHFGGTLSTTPLTAEVAAFVLSLDPTLTWQEVRDIFNNTAVKLTSSTLMPKRFWAWTAVRWPSVCRIKSREGPSYFGE